MDTSILDDALNEFDFAPANGNMNETTRTIPGGDAAINEAFQNIVSEMKGNTQTAESVASNDDIPIPTMDPFAGMAGGDSMDKTLAEALNMLQSAAAQNEGMEPASVEAAGEKMMDDMMGEFQNLSQKEDFNGVIEGMMRQLLAKDIMYLPVKEICLKFPEWLADHEDSLEPEEYEKYGKMYQQFQRIVALYDNEPNNYERLMELMQELQEYGQPPADIIKQLAPDLKVAPNGMPIFPGTAGAGFPDMSQMAGGGCSIM